MGDDEAGSGPVLDGVLENEGQVIGHFDVGPAGVGPMVDVNSGEFYPSLSTAESAAIDSTPD